MRSIIAQIHLSQTISLIFTFQKKKKKEKTKEFFLHHLELDFHFPRLNFNISLLKY